MLATRFLPQLLFTTAMLFGFRSSPATEGSVLVANQADSTASLIDLATGTVTTLRVGAGPHETAIDPTGHWGLVTVYGIRGAPGNQLAVIDIEKRAVARIITLGTYTRPHGAKFLPGRATLAILTSETTGNAVIVDYVAGKVIDTIPTHGRTSHMIALTSDGKRGFTANIADGAISELNLDKRAFVRQLSVAPQTEGIAAAPDGSTVWVGSNQAGTVSVVETRGWTVEKAIPGFGAAYRLGMTPDGRTVLACDPQQGVVRVLDVGTRSLVGAIAIEGFPEGVYIAPDSRTAFVTLNQGNAVGVIDVVDRKVLRTIPVGHAPDGVSWGPPIH